jgi:hypothetical protein
LGQVLRNAQKKTIEVVTTIDLLAWMENSKEQAGWKWLYNLDIPIQRVDS